MLIGQPDNNVYLRPIDMEPAGAVQTFTLDSEPIKQDRMALICGIFGQVRA